MILSMFVPGIPAPQGSKNAYANGGRIRLVESSPLVKPWRATIAAQCHETGVAGKRYDLPLSVTLRFLLPRPRGHYGKRGLLPSAPAYPTTKPDADKLVRSVLDALATDAGVIADDSRVVRLVASKHYSDAPGVLITIREVKD